MSECIDCENMIQCQGGESYYYFCDKSHFHGKPEESTKGIAKDCPDFVDKIGNAYIGAAKQEEQEYEQASMVKWIEELEENAKKLKYASGGLTMENILKHKGFVGSVGYEDGSYHGKILYIKDLVTYEAKTIDGLGVEFKVSVDDYINLRNELGRKQ